MLMVHRTTGRRVTKRNAIFTPDRTTTWYSGGTTKPVWSCTANAINAIALDHRVFLVYHGFGVATITSPTRPYYYAAFDTGLVSGVTCRMNAINVPTCSTDASVRNVYGPSAISHGSLDARTSSD